MRIATLLSLLSIGGAVAAELADGVAAGAAQTLPTPQANQDAVPTARESEPISLILPIRNHYDRAVKITHIESTCSCTKLEVLERFLAPGATTMLHLTADNRNRSGAQQVTVSLYVSDPEFEPLETVARWQVRAAIQVDAIGPMMDPLVRPADRAWQDIYRYVSKERPDELNRLKKRIRLSCPPDEVPAGGLRVTGIDYRGTLWAFSPTSQPDGSVLITAKAKDVNAIPAEGTYDEPVTLRTNHPDKTTIALRFLTIIDRKAGERSVDPFALPK